MSQITKNELEELFKGDRATSLRQHDTVEGLRSAGRNLALCIYSLCPPGIVRDTAILKINEAIMLANQAIVCESVDGGDGEYCARCGSEVKV